MQPKFGFVETTRTKNFHVQTVVTESNLLFFQQCGRKEKIQVQTHFDKKWFEAMRIDKNPGSDKDNVPFLNKGTKKIALLDNH